VDVAFIAEKMGSPGDGKGLSWAVELGGGIAVPMER